MAKFGVMQQLIGNLKCKLLRFISPFFGTRMLYGFIDRHGNYLPETRISNTAFIFSKKSINIENNVFIGHFSILDATFGLTIEEGCQIGFFTGIFTHSSHEAIRLYGKSYMHVADKVAYHTGPVHVGAYSFIGAHATILPGTKIGKGCVISAYSLVKGDFPDYSIISGSPAKIIGDVRQNDERLLKKYPNLVSSYMGGKQ